MSPTVVYLLTIHLLTATAAGTIHHSRIQESFTNPNPKVALEQCRQTKEGWLTLKGQGDGFVVDVTASHCKVLSPED